MKVVSLLQFRDVAIGKCSSFAGRLLQIRNLRVPVFKTLNAFGISIRDTWSVPDLRRNLLNLLLERGPELFRDHSGAARQPGAQPLGTFACGVTPVWAQCGTHQGRGPSNPASVTPRPFTWSNAPDRAGRDQGGLRHIQILAKAVSGGGRTMPVVRAGMHNACAGARGGRPVPARAPGQIVKGQCKGQCAASSASTPSTTTWSGARVAAPPPRARNAGDR